jgi:hypothetical protein
MADEPTSLSILAQHVAGKRRNVLYGTPIMEISAIALDLSAMMAQAVPILELIADIPEVQNSANGVAIRSHLSRLKARFQAHAEAMAELNRVR